MKLIKIFVEKYIAYKRLAENNISFIRNFLHI